MTKTVYVDPGDTVIVRKEKDIPEWKRKGFTSQRAYYDDCAQTRNYEQDMQNRRERWGH